MKKLNFKAIGMRAAGVVAGGAVSTVSNKFLANLNPKLRAAIKIGAGCLLPELAPKNKIVADAGIALAGAGAAELTSQFMGVSGVYGVGADPEYTVNGDEYNFSGTGDDVSGTNDAMSGTNDALNGDDLADD